MRHFHFLGTKNGRYRRLTIGLSLMLVAFLSTCGTESTSTPASESARPAESIVTPTPSPAPQQGRSTPTPTPTIAPAISTTPLPLPAEPCVQSPETCEQRDISNFNPIRGETGGFGGAGYVVSQDEPTVEEILEKGLRLSEASPVHIAFRGAASKGSFRCAWRGVARTAGQREGAIRLWLGIEEDDPLPPAADIENQMSAYLGALGAAIPWYRSFLGLARGGLVDEYQFLTCYADYHVQEYLLGSGPAVVTVAYDHLGTAGSYEIYTELHAAGLYGGGELQGEDEYAALIQETLLTMEAIVAGLIGDRESIVFLAPMGAYHVIAVEAWLAVAQWDLQIGESNGIDAVRYGTRENDAEFRQPLDELRQRIHSAGETDGFAGKRIPNVQGLQEYYDSIGAYDIIGPYNIPRAERTPFVPAKPPPPRPPRERLEGAPTPEPVPAVEAYEAPTFVAISAGGSFSCGLEAEGSVVCWGSNVYKPTFSTPGQRFETISSGAGIGCGILNDGSIGCWGNPNRGKPPIPSGKFTEISVGRAYDAWVHVCALGEDGTAVCWGQNHEGQSSPPAGVRFTSISSGYDHTCGLRADGTPECWGNSARGKTLPPADVRFVSISAGLSHTCGLRSDGTPVCWGANNFGQSLPPVGEYFVIVSAGDWHTCGIRRDGIAMCWGFNRYNQLMVPAGEKLISIDSGKYHTCALRQDGSAVCWGEQRYGKSSAPGTEIFTHISAGSFSSCALRTDGIPVCWGDNDVGESTPPEGEILISLTSRGRHSCGLRPDGTAVCWGGNEHGQSSPPTDLMFSSISTGLAFTCGLMEDGTAFCWGGSGSGLEQGAKRTLHNGQRRFSARMRAAIGWNRCLLGKQCGWPSIAARGRGIHAHRSRLLAQLRPSGLMAASCAGDPTKTVLPRRQTTHSLH